jgi:hypothetical protein
MNYAEYLRKKERSASKIIGFQSGQDASQVTYKNQAWASAPQPSVTSSTSFNGGVATNFSKPGGSVANINQIDTYPTNGLGVLGVANGQSNIDTASLLIHSAQYAAFSTMAMSSAPYITVIPCSPIMSTISNAPGTMKCCTKDTSQLYRDNSELIADQGRQASLRTHFNLPAKLQGLRGPVYNSV